MLKKWLMPLPQKRERQCFYALPILFRFISNFNFINQVFVETLEYQGQLAAIRLQIALEKATGSSIDKPSISRA